MVDTSSIFDSMIRNTLIIFGVTLVLGFLIIIWARRRSKPNAELLKTGLPAQAQILKIWQTGLMINNNPEIGLLLDVQGPTGQYQTEAKLVVPMVHIPQFQPGATLPVKIHPTDRSKLAFDIYG